MNLSLRDAILTAISYADIFDYPMTAEELQVWLPYKRRSPARSQESVLRSYRSAGVAYYALRTPKRLIGVRTKRNVWSAEKWIRARRVANLLNLIPTIRLVGVTGGLTRSNAREDDDIDVLIITASRTMWITRALSTILLDLLRLRRRPTDAIFRNLICLNMFMSEDGLGVSRKERDLFTAHEVLLMTPLRERCDTYSKFLQANRWVERFLPNAWKVITQNSKFKTQNHNAKLKSLTVSRFLDVVLRFEFYVLRLLEPAMMKFQLSYMKKRRSTEVVTDTVIRFHPRDARVWIKSALGRRLSRLKIPLDKIFYGR